MTVKDICDEIDVLIKAGVTTSSPQFDAWFDKAEEFISGKYGKNSDEYKSFKKIMFFPLGAVTSRLCAAEVEACSEGLRDAKDFFEGL